MKNPDQLDYIAENILPPDESWAAAQHLGKYIAREVCSTYTSEDAHYFHIDGVDEVLLGVSEQPDLSGEVIVTMHQNRATWCASRQAALQNARTPGAAPMFKAPYVGLHVMHAQNAATLLEMALPASPIARYMMRRGFMTTHDGSPHNLTSVLKRYNLADVAFEPRRVQVAAWLTRKIVSENIAPSYFLLSPEEEQAFLDEHFPYQDLPLTGGGGKTVRRRAARPM